MNIMKTIVIFCFAVFSLNEVFSQSANIAKSLGMYVFPAKDQTKDQQDLDEFSCYKWAKEQTGYDPMNPTKVAVEQVETGPDGTMVKSAAKGAAMGAAIGAIAGDAGKGAAIGATAGGFRGLAQKGAQDQAAQQQAQNTAKQKEAEMLNNYKKAFSVCMEGKGYTVK